MLIDVPGARIHVTVTGDGPAVLLLHGWPHTSRVWDRIIDDLAINHTVIAPDLRGIGASAATEGDHSVKTLAGDIIGVLDALNLTEASLVAIDASVGPAFLVALQHPARVVRLVLMEGLLPGVTGAEAFLASGAPWWFGFHAVPGLAETVVQGNEDEYLGYFLTGPSVRVDIGSEARDAFVTAYSGINALRAGFGLYRTPGDNARDIQAALVASRLTVPTLAVSGGVVGPAIHSQLLGVADDLRLATIVECGHIIPLEQPAALVAALKDFLDTPLIPAAR